MRTSDARRVVPLLEEHGADLVLLDLHMPHRTGFQVLEEVRARTAPGEYLPVLVLTADATADAKERALSGGANDFLIKPLFGT
ncbi:MAG TPA: response regulator, partial [Longimicrobiaceae bacterium]|nr:response regulator [Longimicrobiaceae bacterium]